MIVTDMSLSGQFGDKEKTNDKEIIIKRFCELFKIDHIKIILGKLDERFLSTIEQIEKEKPGKLDHKKYASFLYEIVESNFLVNSQIGEETKDGMPNREFFLCMLLIAENKKNKSLLVNIRNIFTRNVKPQQDSVTKCSHCKKTWEMDDKEYRFPFHKNKIIRCVDFECYTKQLHNTGLQFDDTKKLYKFFVMLGITKKWVYEEIAICLNLPSSCAAAMSSGQRPVIATVRPIEPLNPLYDFQSEISQKISNMLENYNPDNSKAIVALPTGSGKTRLVVETLTDWINSGKQGKDPNKRFILWIVERQELCIQAYNEFQNVFTNKGQGELKIYPFWGSGPRGTSKNIEEIFNQDGANVVIIASKNSLDRKAIEANKDSIRELGKRCSIVIFDEVHRGVARGYVKLQTALGFRMGSPHPDRTILLGLTATPFRGKKKKTEELERRFGNKILWPTLGDDIPPNQKPVPILMVQDQAIQNQVVRMYGERSYDKDGVVAEYRWEIQKIYENLRDLKKWGNETIFDEVGNKKNISHKFTEPGQYRISLRVSDDDNVWSETVAEHNITILKPKPETYTSNAEQMSKLYHRLTDKQVLSKIEHRILGYTGIEYENATISEKEYEDLSDDNIRQMGEDPDRNNMLIEELKNLILVKKKKSILFFGCSLDHSREIAMRLNAIYGDEGIIAAHVHGGTNDQRRSDIVKQFKEQKINVLCNWGLFTTGLDIPKIDCIFVGRPTFSLLLYTQMIGRGLRGPKNKGTEKCLVVDTDEQFQNYKVLKDYDEEMTMERINKLLDGNLSVSDEEEEKYEQAWRIFNELWVTDEKEYWYDGKFHRESPPDSVKTRKVNLEKPTASHTPSKYLWKCNVCGIAKNIKTKADRALAISTFGRNQRNVSTTNKYGYNLRCNRCKQNSAVYIQENLHIIKKFEKEGKIEFSHQINKLIRFFKDHPEYARKYEKCFQYVKQKQEKSMIDDPAIDIGNTKGLAFCSHCGQLFKEGNGVGSLKTHLAAVKATVNRD